jgi:iron(II)-dependent oxidoreductase
MVGNVWEWTRSLWGENFGKPAFGYPYRTDDGRENLEAPDAVLRVSRGGGFYYGAGGARSSARFMHFPEDRYWLRGFRLLLSPFSSDL